MAQNRPADVNFTIDGLRRKIVENLHAAGGGHFGGCLSVIDLLYVLWKELHLTGHHEGQQRDFLVLSKGHAAMALYVLAEQHNQKLKLSRFGRLDGPSGHPDMTEDDLVSFSTGSLGQGLSAALGAALVLQNSGREAWAVLGDGECQEGQVWEAAMLAARYRIGCLNAVIDLNGRQEYGWLDDDMISEPLPEAAEKWRAFGWDVHLVDGHDHVDIKAAVRKCRLHKSSPSVIIAKTIKGGGVPFFSQNPELSHCTSLSTGDFERVIRELRGE